MQVEYDALIAYLIKHLTKQDLARLVADISYGRSFTVPSEEMVAMPLVGNPRRGRPSREELLEKAQPIWQVVAEMFPVPVAIEDIALATGLGPRTVSRIQKGNYPDILETCPPYYLSYFLQLPSRKAPITSRLIGSWRAILDLHGFHLAMEHGQVPDLFTTHALFWSTKGLAHAGQAGRLTSLNLYEMQRVLRLADMVHDTKGWPLPSRDAITAPSHDASSCIPLMAYHTSPMPPLTLHTFVEATGTPDEWWELPDTDIALPGQQAQGLLSWAVDFLDRGVY